MDAFSVPGSCEWGAEGFLTACCRALLSPATQKLISPQMSASPARVYLWALGTLRCAKAMSVLSARVQSFCKDSAVLSPISMYFLSDYAQQGVWASFPFT